jgi:50S ribosomal protein L16 3-hydroxylase
MSEGLLAGMPVARFLRNHWQKRPLLVRQAMPGFEGLLSVDALFALASRDDVESRLVMRERGRWSLEHGPFSSSDRRGLPPRNWTLLVQGVNLHLAAGDALLRRFDFLPYARLDDLMVSYAAPGGGVGPHFDSYDVFLLQGFGRRLWRTSGQRDLALRPRLPLKILARFRPRDSWLLAPGDMLYLPPRIAHDGIAIDACTTYSIGFRAPAAQELAVAFLDWLRDRLELDGHYQDRDLAPTAAPARISAAMRAKAAALLRGIRWDGRSVDQFLGAYLTEPKPMVRFERPMRPLAPAAFRRTGARRGLHLDTRAQLLYDERHLFMNGEATAFPRRGGDALRRLANARELSCQEFRHATAFALLYRWYRDGFLHLP